MSSLTHKDYLSILKYYKLTIPKSKIQVKNMAEDLMASKLCRCIKRIDMINEAKSIGICTKTIFNNKGFTRGKFKCKGKMYANFTKTRKKRKQKTSR
jgi:hypothetical protein